VTYLLIVVTLCAQLTRDLLATTKFLVYAFYLLIVVTLCAQLTRDLLATTKFLVYALFFKFISRFKYFN